MLSAIALFNAKRLQKRITEYEESIRKAEKVFWPLLFACGIFTDLFDIVPFFGKLVKIICLGIIWYHLYIKLRAPSHLDDEVQIKISWRVRLFFRLLGIVDLIPFIGILPLTTLSIFIVWKKTRKQVLEKKQEIVKLEQKLESLRGNYSNRPNYQEA